MSAIKVMTALAAILPAGTPIAQTVIQKGVTTESVAGTPSFPALILNAPDGVRNRMGIGPYGPWQWTHQIHALYIDRWEAGSRTMEQLLADADTCLDTMVGNVSLNQRLFDGTKDNAMTAGDRIDKHLDSAVTDTGLGFPVVSGYLIIEVLDLWETWAP